ncbi:F-box domain-containing protein [Caenorhabditis elegans]|uniref:F-box domain-containing protein n=1 Tax=Caenorhabditis elegans TaxID=6239 RepID=Q9XVB8_CAEEL|nr:F-box domain-containing protein [Caenorhabditis elegans]CAB03963.1 F-box domain-containing protein [Caenorhabditis elegans]|eukprot:NP_507766.1 F-box B protein [Caenorhabditis elegans]
MTTTTSFPILHLPAKSLKRAICCLTPEEIIKFSLISKCTKRAAESLNLQYDIHWIKFEEFVSIDLRRSKSLIKWNPLEVELRKLIDHIKSVFHTNKLEVLIIQSDNHDWKSVHEALDGLDCSRTGLEVQSQNRYLQKIINKFSKRDLDLIVSSSTWYHPILSSNRKYLTLTAGFTDLLCVNCKYLIVQQPVTARDLNLMLKHWIKGAYLSVHQLEVAVNSRIRFDDVFKNVEYTEICILEEMWAAGINLNFADGRNIYRFDGERAIVVQEDRRTLGGDFFNLLFSLNFFSENFRKFQSFQKLMNMFL